MATTLTKKVMRRLPHHYVQHVLAMTPKEPAAASFPQPPKRISEESRRRAARVNELIRANNDLIRSIQEYYRRELDTKGYVEVEVEEEVQVSDQDFEADDPSELAARAQLHGLASKRARVY